jgi:integrase
MKSLKPINNHGGIQLKFSLAGKRYSFHPIPGGRFADKRDLATAQAIATQIENALLSGHFDPTLQTYRLAPKTTSSDPSPVLYGSMLELWDAWVITLDISEETKSDHYEMIRRMIVKHSPLVTQTNWLTSAKIAPSTFNKRLGYLKSCFKWAMHQGCVENDPVQAIKTRKVTKPEIKPFSASEMTRILQSFEQICPHYTPFVRFLFLTGCRISEAIGLQWLHVDFEQKLITVSESLSIDRTGNGYKRKRKSTKTGNVRLLPFNTPLEILLNHLKSSSCQGENLIFTTVKGCVIDAGNFRTQYWMKVLEHAQVPYRKIHTSRHTTASYAIYEGIPITAIAYLLGHKDPRMVMQTYGHLINKPDLPDMPI